MLEVEDRTDEQAFILFLAVEGAASYIIPARKYVRKTRVIQTPPGKHYPGRAHITSQASICPDYLDFVKNGDLICKRCGNFYQAC